MAEPRKDDAVKSVQVEALVSLAFLSLRLPTHLFPAWDDGCERDISRRCRCPTCVFASPSLRRRGMTLWHQDGQAC